MLRIDSYCKSARTKAQCKQKPNGRSQRTSVSDKSTSIEINHGSTVYGSSGHFARFAYNFISLLLFCVLSPPLLSASCLFMRALNVAPFYYWCCCCSLFFFYRTKNVYYSPIAIPVLQTVLWPQITQTLYGLSVCVFCWFSQLAMLVLVERNKNPLKKVSKTQRIWAIVMRLDVMTLKQENAVIERLLRLTRSKRNTIEMV